VTLPEPAADGAHESHETRVATLRRAPRMGVFIGLGAILGIILTVSITTAFPADPNVGMWATVAYMSLFGITGGIVLGAIVGLIADRVSRRHTRIVTVERGTIEWGDEPETPVEPAPAATDPAVDSPEERS